MERVRLLGPPMVATVTGLLAAVWAILEVVYVGGVAGIARALIAAVIAWRALGVAVYLDRGQVVARNVIGSERFPIDEVDIRPRVFDIREDTLGIPPTTAIEAVPTMPDDTTSRPTKRYVIVHGESLYNVDALLGRLPRNHEREALELRMTILRLRESRPD